MARAAVSVRAVLILIASFRLLLLLAVRFDGGDHLLGRRGGVGALVQDRVERVARRGPDLAHRRQVREWYARLRLGPEAQGRRVVFERRVVVRGFDRRKVRWVRLLDPLELGLCARERLGEGYRG